MTLEILPQKLFTMHNVKPLMQQNNAAIFHKTLERDLLDKEVYLSQSAFIYIVKGSQLLQQTTVKQGDILFLPKDIYLVSDYTTQNNQFEAILFFITDEIIDRIRPTNTPINSTTQIQVHTPNAQVAKYMASLVDIYATPSASPNIQLLELKLQELLALLGQSKTANILLNSFYNATQARKRDITQFMKDNYLKNLKVEDYATLTGHSKSTFTRAFKKLYNTTPHQWLITQRLAKAQQILAQGNLNITQTALAVGYENMSHFAQAYKKLYGINPNQIKPTS